MISTKYLCISRDYYYVVQTAGRADKDLSAKITVARAKVCSLKRGLTKKRRRTAGRPRERSIWPRSLSRQQSRCLGQIFEVEVRASVSCVFARALLSIIISLMVVHFRSLLHSILQY